MKGFLLALLVLLCVSAETQFQQGTDRSITWSGACQHTLQCDNQLGRYVDVTVEFLNSFSSAPQVLLAIKTFDAATGFPMAFDISLQSVTSTNFVYRVTAETELWIGTVHVNWLAVLDSGIQIKYVNRQVTDELAVAGGDAAQQEFWIEWDRAFECEQVVASAFTLGGFSSKNQQEFITYITSSQQDGVALQVDVGQTEIEWASFVVVGSCAQNMESFFVGQQVEYDDTNWTNPSGGRFQIFEKGINHPEYLIGGFYFQGISGMDFSGTRNARISIKEDSIDNGVYQVKIGTWADTYLHGAFVDAFTYLPKSDCAILYSECGYQGDSLKVCSGSPISSFEAAQWALTPVKSVSVPPGRVLTMFDAENLEGPYVQVHGQNVECSSGWVFTAQNSD